MRLNIHAIAASLLLATQAAAEPGKEPTPAKAGDEVAALLVQLRDPDPVVRRTAAERLNWHGAQRARIAPALIAALNDADEEVRARAVRSLGMIHAHDTAAPHFIKAAADPKVSVRAAATYALSYIPLETPGLYAALLVAVKDEQATVRQNAINGLGRFDKKALPDLAQAFRDDDPYVRQLALWWLGNLGVDRDNTLPLLIAGIKDKSYLVRQTASRHLAWYGEPAVPYLIPALKDSDGEVRQNAIDALSRAEPAADKVLPFLHQALKDENMWVRRMAANCVQRYEKAALPVLLDALRNDDAETRARAAFGLGQWGNGSKEVEAALRRATEDSDGFVRSRVVCALAHFGLDEFVPALAELVTEKNDQVRYEAINLLAGFGPKSKGAVPALIEALRDPNQYIVNSVIIALGQIGPEARAALPALDTLRSKASRETHNLIDEAVTKIRGPK